jgi:hypothetical protein
VLLLVSLTEERAIYLALESDRSWTEMTGVNPMLGAPAFTVNSSGDQSLKLTRH